MPGRFFDQPATGVGHDHAVQLGVGLARLVGKEPADTFSPTSTRIGMCSGVRAYTARFRASWVSAWKYSKPARIRPGLA